MEMQDDLKALQNLCSIYEQIINNPRLFDEEYLRRFPKDYDYNADLIKETYDSYYSEDS